MRFTRQSPLYRLGLRSVFLTLVAAATAGCTSLVEDFATHLAEKDVKAMDHELGIFDTDLGLFRKCLKERGGSCQGSDTTALPHSSQHAATQAVSAVSSGSSQALRDAVAKLPAGDPAKAALGVLGHPVVGLASALHDHLRGHDTGSVPGFSVEKGQRADGGAQSTASMSLRIGDAQDLHDGLLSTLGTKGWRSLHERCKQLLAAKTNDPGRSAIESDCRRVAFIRSYFEAYMRSGKFLEVDVQLTGAIQAVNNGAAAIEGDIAAVLGKLQAVETDVGQTETAVLAALGADAAGVGGEVQALVAKVEGAITGRFGKAAEVILSDLRGLSGEVAAKSEALAQAADSAAAKDVQALVSELNGLLGKVKTALDKLESGVGVADQKVVGDIDQELGKADAALSNVFKVSNVGFVSRDHTFQARLPTIEVTLDPTAHHLVKATDVDTGQVMSGRSAFGDMGVATDTSGVGTGSSIGAEVMRVFLEAVFDAHEGLPAVAPANLPTVKPTGLTLSEYDLPLFTSPMGNVDSADLSRMTQTNDQVAAKTRAILSRVLAGIGPFSLNNPPLEAFIVEIIATSVRQATSKATWCWYACNLDADVKALEADAKTAVDDKERAVEKGVEGEVKAKETEVVGRAAALEAEMKKHATADAEHVKLRLKLTK